MDSQLFKMPNVPLITIPLNSFNGKHLSKYPCTNNNQPLNIGLSNKQQLEKNSKLNRANINMNIEKKNEDNFSNGTALNTKFCSSCSKILMKTLLPIENCIENLYKLVDPLVLSQCKQMGNSISANFDQTISINDNNADDDDDDDSNNELKLFMKMDACKSINDNDRSIAKNNDHPHGRTNILNKNINDKEENIYNSAILDEHGTLNNNGDNKMPLNFSSSSNNHFQDGHVNIDYQQKNNNDVINYNNQQAFIKKETVTSTNGQFNVCPSKTNQSNEAAKLSAENINSNDGRVLMKNNSINQINKHLDSIHLDDSLKQNEFAFVTIISNNLSAINAILLAQSIYLNNNHSLNWKNLENCKIDHYYIPIVALIGNCIDSELRFLISNFFDQVIELNTNDLVLLNNESLGINHMKVHLWKQLANQFKKCIYLESNTLVIGQISNLFFECQELSACVDCFFPDYFNSSVFLFEPDKKTYHDLIQFGVNQCSNDDNLVDTIDEITLLNEFFKSKWHKLSFIYNFIQNNSSYTQMAAYFKFGGNIRVVNFGRTGGSHCLEPWNYQFDLCNATINTGQETFTNDSIDNYFKFYLLLFVRRLWPLLSPRLTPLMLKRNKWRKLWSIQDLVQIIDQQSGINGNPLEKYSFTLLRKIKSENNLSLFAKLDPEYSKKNIKTKDNADDDDDDNVDENDLKKLQLTVKCKQEQTDAETKNRYGWENGPNIDWMIKHRSDKIINRLKKQFH